MSLSEEDSEESALSSKSNEIWSLFFLSRLQYNSLEYRASSWEKEKKRETKSYYCMFLKTFYDLFFTVLSELSLGKNH